MNSRACFCPLLMVSWNNLIILFLQIFSLFGKQSEIFSVGIVIILVCTTLCVIMVGDIQHYNKIDIKFIRIANLLLVICNEIFTIINLIIFIMTFQYDNDNKTLQYFIYNYDMCIFDLLHISLFYIFNLGEKHHYCQRLFDILLNLYKFYCILLIFMTDNIENSFFYLIIYIVSDQILSTFTYHKFKKSLVTDLYFICHFIFQILLTFLLLDTFLLKPNSVILNVKFWLKVENYSLLLRKLYSFFAKITNLFSFDYS